MRKHERTGDFNCIPRSKAMQEVKKTRISKILERGSGSQCVLHWEEWEQLTKAAVPAYLPWWFYKDQCFPIWNIASYAHYRERFNQFFGVECVRERVMVTFLAINKVRCHRILNNTKVSAPWTPQGHLPLLGERSMDSRVTTSSPNKKERIVRNVSWCMSWRH